MFGWFFGWMLLALSGSGPAGFAVVSWLVDHQRVLVWALFALTFALGWLVAELIKELYRAKRVP